jgi:hypothetical protein
MHQFALVSVLSFIFGLSDRAIATSVSLLQVPLYASQRTCAQDCFSFLGYSPDRIGELINCGTPYENECICRADLQQQVDAFLSSCVNRGCSGAGIDTNSATSIYDSYCTDAGFLRASATPTTLSTAGKQMISISSLLLSVQTQPRTYPYVCLFAAYSANTIQYRNNITHSSNSGHCLCH